MTDQSAAVDAKPMALGVPTLEGICPSCDALSDDAHFCDPCEDLALDEWPENFGVAIRRFVIGHEIALGRAAREAPTDFWSSLTHAQALALLRAAPRVAGAWRTDGFRFVRTFDAPGADTVVATVSMAAAWEAWPKEGTLDRFESVSGDAANIDAAKAAADAALVAVGWVLE